jgi:hypothetical protein
LDQRRAVVLCSRLQNLQQKSKKLAFK